MHAIPLQARPKSRVPARPDSAGTRSSMSLSRRKEVRQPGSVQCAVRNHGFADPWLCSCAGAHHERWQASKPRLGPLCRSAAVGNCRPFDCRLPPRTGLASCVVLKRLEVRSGLGGIAGVPCPRRCVDARPGDPHISCSPQAPPPSPPKPCPGDPRNVISFHVLRRQLCRPIVTLLPRSSGVAPRCHCQPIPDCPTVLSNRQLSRCSSRWRRLQGLRRVEELEG